MKKFTKFMLVILMLALAFVFVGCKKEPEQPVDETPKALQDAIDAVYALYKDKAAETPADWTVTAKSGDLEVKWTVTVTQGAATDVVLTASSDGAQYTVDVNEKSATEIKYTLKATITLEGKSLSKEFTFTVPAYQVQDMTYAQYVAAEKGADVIVKGVVTAVIGKANGSSNNCLYLQDADGAYYAYGLSTDPSAEGDAQVKPGMTVRVTGKKDDYKGTLEVASCSYEIVDKTIKAATPADYTAAFAAATSLKDEALVGKQSLLVKIDNALLLEEDDSVSSGYYKFQVGSLVSYVRLSTSVCPLNATQQATFKENHKAGFEATVTGVVCVYNGEFYLTPVDENCWSNLTEHVLTDAEVVAAEKTALEAPVETVDEAGVVELPNAGATYTDRVSITWESESEYAVISVSGDKTIVTFTLPAEDTTVVLTATLTAGTESDTVEFEVFIAGAPEEPVESAFSADKYEGELAKLAKEFVADYNANGGANISSIELLDTNYLDSPTMSDFLSKEEMIEKWYWLLSALTNLSGDSSHDPYDTGFDPTGHKGFYLANINGFFTKTMHTDTWLAYDSMDFADPANFGYVMDTYLFGNLAARLGAEFVEDYNATCDTELEVIADLDTMNIDSDTILAFFNDEAMGAKWGWLKTALMELAGVTEPSKGFLLANINAVLNMSQHQDVFLEDESMDFTNMNKVRAVLNVYINAHPEENEVDMEPETSTDVLIVNPAWADKEEGAKVTFNRKAYLIGTNAFASIDDAIAAAAEGATIQLAAGEYAGAEINVADVTLSGPNAGQNPNFGPRKDEAVFKGDLKLSANGITVIGIELTENGRIIAGEGDLEDLTVENVFVNGATLNVGNVNNNAPFYFAASSGNVIKNLTIKNSRIVSSPDTTSDRPMIAILCDIENLTITGNEFIVKQVNYNDGIKVIDGGAFGVKGDVEINDNYFAHFQQYTIWMRHYANGTFNILNNIFDDCGLTTASHGMATFVNWHGTADGDLAINMSYNTMDACMILLRIDAASDLPEGTEFKANYNTVTDHKGDFFIKNSSSVTVDASYGYWAGVSADAKFLNATYANEYSEVIDVPAIGDADEENNTYTVTYDLAGGEWLDEGDATYIYGYSLYTGIALKDGFDLAYWVDANGQIFEMDEFPTTLHQNLKLMAVWKAAEEE